MQTPAIDYFLHRCSCRNFRSEVPSKELIRDIVAVATRAPNTGNMQLYSVVETRDEKTRSKMAPMHFSQPASVAAPILLTICADVRRFERWCEVSDAKPAMRNPQMLLASIIDAVILSQQIVTIAELHGLGTCYLGTVTYNAPQIAELLRLPQGVVPITCLAMGYPDVKPQKCERLPIEAIFHSESYSEHDDNKIKELYRIKDDFEPNRKFITENGKQTLAQVFTDVRYPASNNIPFSKTLQKFLRNQGFEI